MAATLQANELGRVAVVGVGVMGEAVARSLSMHGIDVVLTDDHPSDRHRILAADLGVAFIEAPDDETLRTLLADCDALVPFPGLPETHRAFTLAAAADVPVISEFDLAGMWDSRPLVTITGTNGKTTVTTMVTDMLNGSGLAAAAVGNTDVPLIAAIEDDTYDVFVVEASSFRLAQSRYFRPAVGTWLNFSPDHLDVHVDLATYERAKARIWSDREAGDVAVSNLDDPVVRRYAPDDAITFSLEQPATYGLVGAELIGPDGVILHRSELSRDLPHDIANGLAAAATAIAAGADLDAVREVLRTYEGLPHRLQFIADIAGVAYYNDSKATVPDAARAAISGFDSVVLIAGGKNKGISLDAMVSNKVKRLIAIGDAAPIVAGLFEGRCPIETGDSMEHAVALAARAAQPGDTVLLSPGCASFDWYSSYGQRGDDFARIVRELAATSS